MQRPWLHCRGRTSFPICAACDTDLPNCQVFGILLVSLLLQANKAMDLEGETSEFIDYDGYGLQPRGAGSSYVCRALDLASLSLAHWF